MRIWLSKPLYEALPFFYLFAGICFMLASIYLDYWHWPDICLFLGFGCLIAGMGVLLKRRDFRKNLVPPDEQDPEG